MVGRTKGITEVYLDDCAIHEAAENMKEGMPDVTKGAMNADPGKTFGQWALKSI